MAMAKKCDICGVLYEGYVDTQCNGISLEKLYRDSSNVARTVKTMDCCKDCMRAILACIDKLKKGEENGTV